jgi:hypothetical protein
MFVSVPVALVCLVVGFFVILYFFPVSKRRPDPATHATNRPRAQPDVTRVPDLSPEKSKDRGGPKSKVDRRSQRAVGFITLLTIVLWLAEPSMNVGGAGVVAIIPLVLLFGRCGGRIEPLHSGARLIGARSGLLAKGEFLSLPWHTVGACARSLAGCVKRSSRGPPGLPGHGRLGDRLLRAELSPAAPGARSHSLCCASALPLKCTADERGAAHPRRLQLRDAEPNPQRAE